jgi:hypothetical protein
LSTTTVGRHCGLSYTTKSTKPLIKPHHRGAFLITEHTEQILQKKKCLCALCALRGEEFRFRRLRGFYPNRPGKLPGLIA